MKNLKTLFPIVMTLLILAVALPAMTVEGKLEADYSINALKKWDIGPYHWEVYKGDDISFIVSHKEGKNFTWNFGDGTSPLSTDSTIISHSFTTNGKYMVNLIAKNDKNDTVKVYGNITVVDMPEAILKVTDELGKDLAPEHIINAGDTVILDASDSKGDIKTYTYGFNLPNAFLPQHQSDDPTYSYTYSTTGTYNVGLRVVDELGNNSQMDKTQFITITVQKPTGDNGSDFELPVAMEIIAGGVVGILIIVVIIILYRNGYIGGPIMMGGGGSSPPPERREEPASRPADLNARMNRPLGAGAAGGGMESLLPKDSMSQYGKPPEEKTVYETKTCPKCKGTIPITSLDRPLKVVCPDCSASFSLKGKPGVAPKPASVPVPTPAVSAPKPDFIYDVKTCPKCKSKIPITSKERPLKVTCPGCSASFTLKGSSSDKSMPSEAPKSAPAPTEDTEVVICPECGKAQPVSASASEATCVSCNTRFGL